MCRIREDGASDVIAFVLIIFLIVTAAAVWMLVVVPDQGREAESAHNDRVLEEFAGFKRALDQLWLNEKIGFTGSHLIPLSPGERSSLSTLLYLAPTHGSGMIRIEPGTEITLYDTHRHYSMASHTWIEGNVTKAGPNDYITAPGPNQGMWVPGEHPTNPEPFTFTLLRMTYTSDNEYAQNYMITYEGGAVWVSTPDGAAIQLAEPTMTHDADGSQTLYLTTADVKKTKLLLGNCPVAVSYSFTGYPVTIADDYGYYGLNGFVKSRKRFFSSAEIASLSHDDAADTPDELKVVSPKRHYIELSGIDAPVITEAHSVPETQALGENLKTYWENIFAPLSQNNGDIETIGSRIVFLSYDLGLDEVSA